MFILPVPVFPLKILEKKRHNRPKDESLRFGQRLDTIIAGATTVHFKGI